MSEPDSATTATLSPTRRSRLLFPELWPPVVLATLFIAIALVVAYHGTFAAPFIFEDLSGIVRNPAIRQLWPIRDVLLPSPAGGAAAAGWPIVNLSLALNHAVGGLDVRGYHAVNLLLHLVASALLFAVLQRTFLQPALRARFGAAAFPLALSAALLWSLHLLQTSAVSYVSQRAEVLAGLFCFLTLYAFVRTAGCHPLDDKLSGRRAGVWGAVGVFACLAGMACREVMLATPVLVVLYDRTFVAGTFREAWRRRWHLHLALMATCGLAVFLLARGAGHGSATGFDPAIGPWGQALTQGRAVAVGLKLAVWPDPLVLDYGAAVIRRISDVWLAVVLLLVFTGATAFALVRRPVLGFAAAWCFVTLVPVASLASLTAQPTAEHRMYLPLAALVAGLVVSVQVVAGRRALVIVLAFIVIAGGLSLRRNADYRSALAIWSDTVAKVPANPRARVHLANALSAAGRPADAVAHYEAALRLAPGQGAVHFNLGGVLLQLGRAREAVEQYEAALRIGPDAVDLHVGLAAALVRLERMPEAVAQYERATRLGLLAAEEQLRFGRALAEVGRIDDALARLQEAVRLNPKDAGAHVVLGMVLSAAGRGAEALRHFFAAVQLAPDDGGAHAALGDALVDAFRPSEAVPHYETALRLQPDQAAILHTSLGNAFTQLGRVFDAIRHYEETLRLNPNNAEAQANLARIRAAALRRGLLKK